MRSLVVIVALLAGCGGSSVTPPDAADNACLGLEEAEPCTSPSGPGTCAMGVCVAFACGNGMLTPDEECEPGRPIEISCEGLGFYTGDVTCEQCRLVTTSCVGTCGDGVVQAIEACDGVPNGSCIDAGFEYGELGCDQCVADVEGCDSFGWRVVAMDAGVPLGIAADGELVAMYSAEGFATFDVGVPLWTAPSATAVAVDVVGDLVLAAEPTTITLRRGPTVEATLVLPIAGSDHVIDAALAEDESVLALVTNATSCTLYTHTAAGWTTQAMPATCRKVEALANGESVVLAGETARWIKTDRVIDVVLDQASAIGADWVAGGGGILTVYGVRGQELVSRSATVGGPDAQVVLAAWPVMLTDVGARGGIGYGITPGELYRAKNQRIEPLGAPNSIDLIAFARDGSLLISSNRSIHVPRRFVESARVWPTGDVAADSHLAVFPDGIVFCGTEVHVATVAHGDTVVGSGACTAVGGGSATNFFVARGAAIEHALVVEHTAPEPIAQFAAEPGTTYARYAHGVLRREATGTWTALPALPASCTTTQLAVARAIVYVGCAGADAGLYELDGTSWTRVRTGAVLGLATVDTLITVALEDDVYQRSVTTNAFEPMGLGAVGVRQLVPALAGHLVALTPTKVWTYQAGRWSPMLIEGAVEASGLLTELGVLVKASDESARYRGIVRMR